MLRDPSRSAQRITSDRNDRRDVVRVPTDGEQDLPGDETSFVVREIRGDVRDRA